MLSFLQPTTSGKVLMSVLEMSFSTTLEAAPCVLTEPQLTLFRFYSDQSVQEGMTDGNHLYRLAKQFVADKRLEAYRYGSELMSQGAPALISVSAQRYVVWRRLGSPSATPAAAL